MKRTNPHPLHSPEYTRVYTLLLQLQVTPNGTVLLEPEVRVMQRLTVKKHMLV